ncbi:MAG TPA: MotA/TolQ/ExbB proton channel family protein [Planctomycetaceae bacterium]
MMDLLDRLSALSTTVIAAAAAVHFAFFVLLWVWFRRDTRVIAASLDRFTRGLKHRSVLDATGGLGDQIEAFLADVNEVLSSPASADERRLLRDRVNILDERRGYLNALPFETAYNVARTMVEAYPLAGVLGTILAIGSALAAPESEGTVGEIVSRFGDAIWSTFAGLVAAIVLMFLNSVLEPKFSRLAENRAHVRETVARAKRELALTPAAAVPASATAGGSA